MDAIDKDRWARLSPLLDEMLELDAAARARRLADLRAEDAVLAGQLSTLLERLPALDEAAFLEMPALPPREVVMIGRVVGAYTIERELGEGGMGSVWLARRTDGRYEGQAAIKFLHGGLLARGDAERFAREGSILARLAHPNIARLIDAGVSAEGGQPYLVLEYIAGEPIDRYCERMALDVEARVRLFLDVLAAVAHAHNRLILHRDLKPSNILVTAAGEVKLLDFGIATLLADGAESAAASELTQRAGRVFTPQYAAPEQLQGGDVTTATDVYALGVLLYVLLGGSHPTAGGTQSGLEEMQSVIQREPRRLSDAVLRQGGPAAARRSRAVRGDLDTIVARALKKAPAERYANAAQLADDLQRYLHDEPIAARPDALGYQLAKFVRRHRWGVAAGGITALALATGAAVALWEAREARLQRVQAEGLIEFMLGDLRKKLQPVGRLEALDAVGERALAYYAAQDADQLDADSLGRRARALHLIGEIAEQRGSLEDASKVLQQAADSTAELMARHPDDGQRVFDHAQSVYWTGYIARRRGLLAEAETAFLQYMALARRLGEIDPKNVDWRLETAYAGGNLGIVYLDLAEPARALGFFEEAVVVWRGVASARPEFQIEVANALGWAAKAHEAQGDFHAAVGAQQAKIDALRQVPDAGKDREVQRLLAISRYGIGLLELVQGRAEAALAPTQEALSTFETLLAIEGSNREWQAQATMVRLSLARIALASNDRALARAQFDRASAELTQLLSVDAMRNKWNVALKGGLLLLKRILDDDTAALRAELEAYLAGVEQARAGGKQLDPEQTRTVSAARLDLGDLLAAAGKLPAASEAWRSAAAPLQKLADGHDPHAMALLARAHLKLGNIQEARALAEKLEASPYRHPLYGELRQQLSQGSRHESR